MTIELSKRDMVSKIVAVAIAIVCYMGFFSLQDSKLVYTAALTCCGALLVRSVKDKSLFIFYLLISSYLIFLYPHYVGRLALESYSFNTSAFQDKTLFLYALFLASALFFYKYIPATPINDRLDIKDNAFVFYLNVVIQLAIILFGSQGKSVMEASYGSNDVQISTINNYFVVFYLASYFSSGKVRSRLLLLNVIAVYYCINSLLLGSRGSTFSMGLVFYLLVMDRRVSFVQLICLILLGFAFMIFWGFVRAGQTSAFFSVASGGIGNLLGFTASLSDKYTMQGGHYTDVFHASVRIVGMVDTGVIDLGDRIYAFMLFIASVFVPYSILPPIANLASYLVGDYMTLGGGLAFAYFYVFLSYFGVVFLAFIVNVILNKLRTSYSKYMLTYCILVFSNINGWFAYNPITLFKLCIWGVLYAYFLEVMTTGLTKKKVSL